MDGIGIQRFAQTGDARCRALLRDLHDRRYRPLPLLQILVEKKAGSSRSRRLLVPTVRDRVLQTAVAQALSKSYEEEFLEVSYAYRPGRGVDRAVARLRQLREIGYEHVVDADIRLFFDSVSFELLEREIVRSGEPAWVLSMISEWLRVPAWDGKRLRHRKKGLPQGSPISPLLANIFLLPLDRALAAGDAKLVRYADDFVILAETRSGAERALERAAAVLQELQLQLHPDKTRLTSFSEGLRFLGVYFQKDEIWQPWKDGPKAQGRILHMASAMPARLLARFEAQPDESEIAAQLKAEGLRWAPVPRKAKEEENHVAYLYLTQQGAILRKSGDRFLVEHDDQIVLDLPYTKLEHILIFGNVQVTTQAIGELLDKGVDLSFFSWRGNFRGSLAPPRSTNVRDRLAQIQLWRDSAQALNVARRIVASKVANQGAVAERIAALAGSQTTLDVSAAVKSAHAAVDLDQLMGVEGAAAREYFNRFGEAVLKPFVWAGRHARPAGDPVNALLSLTYTLLTQELASLAEADGLEVALGCLHQLDRGRPSLALDLVECFRAPVADRLVIALLRQGEFTLEDFVYPEGGGVVLAAPALRRFLGAYESWMLAEGRRGAKESYRSLLRAEVRRFVAFLREQAEFEPFIFSGREERKECVISSLTI